MSQDSQAILFFPLDCPHQKARILLVISSQSVFDAYCENVMNISFLYFFNTKNLHTINDITHELDHLLLSKFVIHVNHHQCSYKKKKKVNDYQV